uniref:Endoplasmic reticulum transmembrane protein n=1 Tax=Noccaea caerulescens TaxID=107243 RepID=A0A1J3J7L9_NOCCA
MQQLLFAVVLLEVVVIIAFSFKTPFRKLLIVGLDRSKRGRGPMVVKTVAMTVSVVLVSSVYSMMKIHKRRWVDAGSMNPTDDVIMAKHLLESTLMGGVLFLGLMIDRLHHYMRELRIRRKSMEAMKKQAMGLESVKSGVSDEIKKMEDEIKALLEKQKELESEVETISKEVGTEKTIAVALQKQSEGFLVEFNRLMEENQNLRDLKLSGSSSIKKKT